MRFVRSAALAFAALSLLDACGEARSIDQSPVGDDCGRCHASSPTSGAHQAHLTGGQFSNPLPCNSCHVVPTRTPHATGRVEIQFSAMARQDVADPAYSAASGTCSVYCHGSTNALGNHSSPAWTSTNGVACGSCHSIAPTSGFHQIHANPYAPYSPIPCVACHPGTYVNPPRVNLATHMNGTFDASPVNTTATLSAWPAHCTDCHTTGVPL